MMHILFVLLSVISFIAGAWMVGLAFRYAEKDNLSATLLHGVLGSFAVFINGAVLTSMVKG